MPRTLLFALGCLALNADACTVKIAYNEVAAPPYYVGDGEKIPADPGASIELINLAATKLGCTVHWLRMPIKRVLRDLEKSAIDATLALSYSKDRAAFAVYPMKYGEPDASLSVWTSSYDFYVKRGSTLKWDGKTFNRPPQGVGANAGFSVVNDLARMGIVAQEARGDANNFGKLVLGRIEVYAAQDLTLEQLNAHSEFHTIEKLTPSFTRKDYYLVFSNAYYADSPNRVRQIWKQVAEYKALYGKALEQKYSVKQMTP